MSLYDDTLRLLSDLVRNACVNDYTPDSGHEHRNADTLCTFFQDTPVNIQRFEPHPGRVSVAFSVPGTDPQAEPLTLLGHTDVVPVDNAHWTVPPFGAEIRDGRIYGRGTVDMLFITAAMAAATREIARGNPLKGDLTFVALADEESRGGLGAGWLAQHQPTAFSWRNTLSETGGSHLPVHDGSDALVVVVGEKGAAQRRIHVVGDAGHGSTPFGRSSTLVTLGEVTRRLAAIEPPVSSSEIWQDYVRAFRFDADTEHALLAGTDPEAYQAFGPLAGYSHAMSRLTIAQTAIHAGGPINVLPSSGYVDLDIRPLPGQSQDDVDEILRAGLGDLADHVQIERLISEEATVSPSEGPLYQAILDTFQEFFPDVPVIPTLSAGGSDLRFARRLGGVGYGFALHHRERTLDHVFSELHSHDENLYLEDLDLTVRAYYSLVQRFLS
ncbi:M20/M25/M40 family metallo-hydrolase [Corynebacterium poyangense]|uniref:M20/M25/M40 family metallo-hydrolase n=1 Tax=Corynebacterium poyangense TaxID=2684405 RepID=A0A7H0SL18_9CORY|nr:M20/M25/M40 family metallo-hydrolase [Corynebacterium poyangense]QNQ89243.1 M20/M25/M40 family metallo-hydrolase [Corynebacterium poyangense]